MRFNSSPPVWQDLFPKQRFPRDRKDMPLRFLRRVQPRIRVSVLPPFHRAPITYHLVHEPAVNERVAAVSSGAAQPERWWVTRATWEREADASSGESEARPPLRLRSFFAAVDPGFGAQWTERMESTPCGFAPDARLVLDGYNFELELFGRLTNLELHWWGDGPAAWREIIAAAHAFVEAVEATPMTPLTTVAVSAYWVMSVPFEHELIALRSLVPAFAGLSMPELWKLGAQSSVSLGLMPIEDAYAMQGRGVGVQLDLPPEPKPPPPWPESWQRVDGEPASLLEYELSHELPEGHVLSGRRVKALAQNQDDALFELADSEAVARVHLTWRQETDPKWPDTRVFTSLEEWQRAAAEEKTEE